MRLASLGVHEHWNNAVDKQYSRNLGLAEGIELVKLEASRPPALLTAQVNGGWLVLSWASSLTGYNLGQTPNLASPVAWSPVTNPPIFMQGLNVVSNRMDGTAGFFRLVQ